MRVKSDRDLLFVLTGHSDIPAFVERCSGVGVSKIVLTFCNGVLESHDAVLCYRPLGETGAEARGTYQVSDYGANSPLRRFAQHAHAHGIEIHPYVLVAIGGGWSGSRRAVSRKINRVGRMPRFAAEHPEYFTKGQDGRSWLDWGIGELVLGYDVGYLSLAYPEVREYERSALVEYVRDFGVDGVQLEFITVLAESEDVWPLGYDEPAIEAYKRTHGVDPREIDNADEDWTRLRASYTTQYLRELRQDLSKLGRKVEVSVATEGVWADPETAYKLMIDWPTWVEEGLVDALHPRFWIVDPRYPLSYPNSETGSWLVDSERIRQEVSKVREVAGDRCLVYGTVLCKNGGEEMAMSNLADRIVEGAEAIMEAGSDGFGIYPDDQLMDSDELWGCFARIASTSLQGKKQ